MFGNCHHPSALPGYSLEYHNGELRDNDVPSEIRGDPGLLGWFRRMTDERASARPSGTAEVRVGLNAIREAWQQRAPPTTRAGARSGGTANHRHTPDEAAVVVVVVGAAKMK